MIRSGAIWRLKAVVVFINVRKHDIGCDIWRCDEGLISFFISESATFWDCQEGRNFSWTVVSQLQLLDRGPTNNDQKQLQNNGNSPFCSVAFPIGDLAPGVFSPSLFCPWRWQKPLPLCAALPLISLFRPPVHVFGIGNSRTPCRLVGCSLSVSFSLLVFRSLFWCGIWKKGHAFG